MGYFLSAQKVKTLAPICVLAACLGGGLPVFGGGLDDIGMTALRAVATNVNGAGIRVAQPEALNGDNGSTKSWEVNPANVAQPVGLFTYTSSLGTSTNYPNSVGDWSSHADGVAQNFYGLNSGVATNVAQVDGYEAEFFITNYVFNAAPMPKAPVVNQSFVWFGTTVAEQQAIDAAYDDYAAQYQTLFISGAGYDSPVCPPATSYNGIGVNAYPPSSHTGNGPTLDNGRCKPDLTAPAGSTSFSTPLVAGVAAVLIQAARRGDGGNDTNAAVDLRTIKALLLNGAVKPANWTNASSAPLDARYGAGVVNALNAYQQLTGGKNAARATNLISLGAAHPPGATANFLAATSGWDFASLSSTATNDAVKHYFFNVPKGMVTATLVWNRWLGATNINDLDLFLYNVANSNLVACSTSRVDNVEHIFLPALAAGRYDLQVVKNGGPNVVSDIETNALAFAFVPVNLTLTRSSTNTVLTWPVYPAGFGVEAATNLATPSWSTNNLVASLTGSTNRVTLPLTNAARFFRLRSPNF